MKSFVKFIKNLLWFCVVLIFIGIMGGICYGFYDYYTGGAEKYDKAYTQAMLWITNTKNKITGEETVELTLQEVSPSKLPEMTLSLEGTSWEGWGWDDACVLYDEELQPVIFVYGKDIGGDLYFPYGNYAGEQIGTAWLFAGNEEDMTDITEHVSWYRNFGEGMISQDFLMGLEPGNYYIFLQPLDEQGEPCGWHTIPLIVEEQTTYISTQQGYAGHEASNGFLINDLQNVEKIILPFYNLGDDRIIMLNEVRKSMTMQTSYVSVSPSDYEITTAGNAVILSEEYLQKRAVNDRIQFQVLLSSGKTLDIGYIYMLSTDGQPDWLSFTGPDEYDQSEGGDLILDYHKGWGELFAGAGYYCEGNLIYEETPENLGDDMQLLDEENNRLIISESTMKTLSAEKQYDFFVSYSFPGMGYIFCSHSVRIVP